MRYPNIKRNILILVLLAGTIITSKTAHAEVTVTEGAKSLEGETGCAIGAFNEYESTVTGGWNISPRKCSFNLGKIAGLFKIDAASTLDAIMTSFFTDQLMKTFVGRTADPFHYCMAEIGGTTGSLSPDIAKLGETENCSDLTQSGDAVAQGIYPTSRKAYNSFLGLALMGEHLEDTQPIPTNLAYYTRHVASETLFVKDTAFAQEADLGGVGNLTMKISLQLWELTRNLAYGLLAIFMLYIGVMIMMRKNIDPRTTVTIQNALPRIIIALALITFSYAIVSLGASMVDPLKEGIKLLIEETTLTGPQGLGPAAVTYLSAGGLSLAVLAAFLTWGSLPFIGIIGFIPVILLMVGFLIVWLTVLIKIQITYIRLAVHAVIAPITLAWGAIPGNEETIQNWFKKLGVLIVTVPAMQALMSAAYHVGLYAAKETWAPSTTPVTGGFASGGAKIIVTLSVPILMIFLLTLAAKMPKKMEEAFMGPTKR